jgi:hypothetical protein
MNGRLLAEFRGRDHVIGESNASNHFPSATSFLPPTSIGLCLDSFNRRTVPPTELVIFRPNGARRDNHLAPMCLMCQAVKRGSASIYYALCCRPFLL